MWRACDGGGGREKEGKMNCNRNNIIEFYKYNERIYIHTLYNSTFNVIARTTTAAIKAARVLMENVTVMIPDFHNAALSK